MERLCITLLRGREAGGRDTGFVFTLRSMFSSASALRVGSVPKARVADAQHNCINRPTLTGKNFRRVEETFPTVSPYSNDSMGIRRRFVNTWEYVIFEGKFF
jgi:hypothetical protein